MIITRCRTLLTICFAALVLGGALPTSSAWAQPAPQESNQEAVTEEGQPIPERDTAVAEPEEVQKDARGFANTFPEFGPDASATLRAANCGLPFWANWRDGHVVYWQVCVDGYFGYYIRRSVYNY